MSTTQTGFCNTFSEGPDERIISPCGRCPHVFVYPAGTRWPKMGLEISDHWNVCTGAAPATSKAMLNQPEVDMEEPLDSVPIVVSTPVVSVPTVVAVPTVENNKGGSTISANGVKPRKRPGDPKRKNIMDENARRAILEKDVWVQEVSKTSVICKGCQKNIALDKRGASYYPGLWKKHRGTCKVIKQLEADGSRVVPQTKEALPVRVELTPDVPETSHDNGAAMVISAEPERYTEILVDEKQLEWEKSYVPFETRGKDEDAKSYRNSTFSELRMVYFGKTSEMNTETL